VDAWSRRRQSFRQLWYKSAVDCVKIEKTEKMLTNVGKSLIPQWWIKWKSDLRYPDHHQSTTSCILPVLVKFGWRLFPRSSVILFTEWQNEWKNDREWSHNISLNDGCNNNNNKIIIIFNFLNPSGIYLPRVKKKIINGRCYLCGRLPLHLDISTYREPGQSSDQGPFQSRVLLHGTAFRRAYVS